MNAPNRGLMNVVLAALLAKPAPCSLSLHCRMPLRTHHETRWPRLAQNLYPNTVYFASRRFMLYVGLVGKGALPSRAQGSVIKGSGSVTHEEPTLSRRHQVQGHSQSRDQVAVLRAAPATTTERARWRRKRGSHTCQACACTSVASSC